MSQGLSEFQLKELFKNRKFNSGLKSVSGKKIEVLQTGDVNSDTGPDFRHSLVVINGITLRGDIELHRLSSDWYAHNHYRDRNYNSVVLHVVTECDDTRVCVTQAGRTIETIELSKFLSADSSAFLAGFAPEERMIPLRCAGDSRNCPLEAKLGYLRLLGEKRFVHKVNKLEERLKDIIEENRPVVFEAKQTYFRDFSDLHIEHRKFDESELQTESYWDQLLYEGIMEGLGYSKNTAPFRKLARTASLGFLKEHSMNDEMTIEAILFATANLLPVETKQFDEESKEYCAKLESAWQPLRKKYKREYVDKAEWLFFKLRPHNFPTIRIAGAAMLLAKRIMNQTAGELIKAQSKKDDAGFLEAWREILIVPSRGFWTRHFVFGTPASAEVRMLIGAGRSEEIIINTVLPLTYLRGRIFHDNQLLERAMRIYGDHPPTADNMITLLIKESLFGGDNMIATVMAQQGALHLYRTLCSEKRCERCKIGRSIYRKTAA